MSYVNATSSAVMESADISLHDKLMGLHGALHPRVRNHNLDLHARWQKNAVVSQESAAALEPSNSWVLTYFRSREQAEKVERLMGKDRVAIQGNVETYRHPVIEFRFTPEHFAIELILSPYAWWDQQNFVGKVQLADHRKAFRELLSVLDSNYCFGFWQGINLSEMHLTVEQLLKGRFLNEWIDTFSDRLDFLRIGKWYDAQDPLVDSDQMLTEAFDVVKDLYSVYTFILWTSNNNFHSFYEKRQQTSRRNLS